MLNVEVTANDSVGGAILPCGHFLVNRTDILRWNLMKVATRSVKFLSSSNVFSHLLFLLPSCNFNFFVSTGGAVLTAGRDLVDISNHISAICTTLNENLIVLVFELF